MLLSIYNIYIESLIFIRKNVFVLLPYVFYYALTLPLNLWLSGNSFAEKLIRSYAPMLIVCFLEMLLIVMVYKNEEIIVSKESIWQIFNRFSGSVLLFTVYSVFVLVVCLVVLMLVFYKLLIVTRLLAIPLALIFVGVYALGLRHLIYHNNIMVMDSIKAGFKDLYKNFFFYLFVSVAGLAVLWLPSLILPSSWFAFPFLPIAEFSALGFGGGINWFRVVLAPIVATLTSVAFTYAYIFKNKKKKHAS